VTLEHENEMAIAFLDMFSFLNTPINRRCSDVNLIYRLMSGQLLVALFPPFKVLTILENDIFLSFIVVFSHSLRERKERDMQTS
jgi:hypothetical protein